MRYRKLTTKHGQLYVDTLHSKVKSIRNYKCGNLYTNNLGFRKFFPMATESKTPSTLQTFITMVGLPPALHADNAKVFVERGCKDEVSEVRYRAECYQAAQSIDE